MRYFLVVSGERNVVLQARSTWKAAQMAWAEFGWEIINVYDATDSYGKLLGRFDFRER